MTNAAINVEKFGNVGQQAVERFTLRSPQGLKCTVCNLGASLHICEVPLRNGSVSSVALGYNSLDDYLTDPFFLGVTVGRVANRIASGRFELDGRQYELERNKDAHHLHGGSRGWYRQVWNSEIVEEGEGGAAVRFSLRSPAGDAGYPGNVTATVTYRVSGLTLTVIMEATTDAPTLVNMAHHTYWNLDGGGSVLDHELLLHCSEYTPGAPVIPSGRRVSVAGTPYDFTKRRPLGHELPVSGKLRGFDTNLVVDGSPRELRPVAELSSSRNDLSLRLEANQPGVQLYSGVFLDGQRIGRNGPLEHAGAVCLETQAFPDAINQPETRDQVLLRPEQRYSHRMDHHFSSGRR